MLLVSAGQAKIAHSLRLIHFYRFLTVFKYGVCIFLELSLHVLFTDFSLLSVDVVVDKEIESVN